MNINKKLFPLLFLAFVTGRILLAQEGGPETTETEKQATPAPEEVSQEQKSPEEAIIELKNKIAQVVTELQRVRTESFTTIQAQGQKEIQEIGTMVGKLKTELDQLKQQSSSIQKELPSLSAQLDELQKIIDDTTKTQELIRAIDNISQAVEKVIGIPTAPPPPPAPTAAPSKPAEGGPSFAQQIAAKAAEINPAQSEEQSEADKPQEEKTPTSSPEEQPQADESQEASTTEQVPTEETTE